MILHETQTVQIAEADWTDDGVVALLTFPTLEGPHDSHGTGDGACARSTAQRRRHGSERASGKWQPAGAQSRPARVRHRHPRPRRVGTQGERGDPMSAALSPTEQATVDRFGLHDEDVLHDLAKHADDSPPALRHPRDPLRSPGHARGGVRSLQPALRRHLRGPCRCRHSLGTTVEARRMSDIGDAA